MVRRMKFRLVVELDPATKRGSAPPIDAALGS